MLSNQLAVAVIGAGAIWARSHEEWWDDYGARGLW